MCIDSESCVGCKMFIPLLYLLWVTYTCGHLYLWSVIFVVSYTCDQYSGGQFSCQYSGQCSGQYVAHLVVLSC